MLPCTVCTKRMDDDEGHIYDSNNGRDAHTMRSLTSQLKDMVLKASETYKHFRPGSAAMFNHRAPSFKEYAVTSNTSFDVDHLKSSMQCSHPSADDSSDTPKLHGVMNAKQEKSALLSSPEHLEAPQQQASRAKFTRRDDECQEWIAQVEPGVFITFLALSDGGNELRRIRFNREMFNKQQAETWWTENSERVYELYNVHLKDKPVGGLRSSTSSNEVSSLHEFKTGVSQNSPQVVGDGMKSCQSNTSSTLSETTSSDVTDVANTIPSSNDSTRVIEDEPGVFITVKIMPGGSKALKRVRFSCDKFNEHQAKTWWEANRFRIHEQYLRKHLPSYTSI